MNQLMIAFVGEKTRQHLSQMFEGTAFSVEAVCGTGTEILAHVDRSYRGAVLCGSSLYDMSVEDLHDALPKGAVMVLLAGEEELQGLDCPNAVKVPAPATEEGLMEAIREAQRLSEERTAVPQRSDADKQLIMEAKELLMARKGLPEQEAYRLIQRTSMNNGAKMVHTARGILDGTISL